MDGEAMTAHRRMAVPWRILVVDDDPLMRQLMRAHLQRLGACVVEAETAGLALDRLITSRFDLLITDIDMPGPSGLWLMQQVRRRWADLPVILATGATPDEAEHGAADAVLYKPFRSEDLLERVEAVLGGSVDEGVAR